ncbi:enoyl-CoA delta isomerase 1, mitochondrial-like [Microplitis mediator]|uniref:enoyl-CoA delta isomerase 1, mitochondrial-like n=1 Tax=Microplitis mediator TaxID=375433 RepID=UPI0025578FAC|nr:enoyl-CoA delta isomerase 1, mitochondrial-like [Microplitis mediator]
MHIFTRKVLKLGLIQQISKRNYSAAGNLITVTKNDTTNTSILSLARPPVNGLNLELLTEFNDSLKKIVKDGSKGVIITSSLPTIFSGGLDIMEMFKPDMKRARQFWEQLQETWFTLYSLSIPTAAAINGSSPAGGCLTAMSCEYRVFVDGKHAIGLNETKLGIVAPSWFREIYVSTIGYRQAELALLQGTLFPPKRALEIGLVDELAADKDEAISKCQKYIDSYARIPAVGRYATKMDFRTELIERLKKNREADTSRFLNFISQPKVQVALELYIKSLKEKK